MQFSLDFSILDPHSAPEGEFDCGSTLHSPGPKAPQNSSPNSYGYTWSQKQKWPSITQKIIYTFSTLTRLSPPLFCTQGDSEFIFYQSKYYDRKELYHETICFGRHAGDDHLVPNEVRMYIPPPHPKKPPFLCHLERELLRFFQSQSWARDNTVATGEQVLRPVFCYCNITLFSGSAPLSNFSWTLRLHKIVACPALFNPKICVGNFSNEDTFWTANCGSLAIKLHDPDCSFNSISKQKMSTMWTIYNETLPRKT